MHSDTGQNFKGSRLGNPNEDRAWFDRVARLVSKRFARLDDARGAVQRRLQRRQDLRAIRQTRGLPGQGERRAVLRAQLRPHQEDNQAHRGQRPDRGSCCLATRVHQTIDRWTSASGSRDHSAGAESAIPGVSDRTRGHRRMADIPTAVSADHTHQQLPIRLEDTDMRSAIAIRSGVLHPRVGS